MPAVAAIYLDPHKAQWCRTRYLQWRVAQGNYSGEQFKVSMCDRLQDIRGARNPYIMLRIFTALPYCKHVILRAFSPAIAPCYTIVTNRNSNTFASPCAAYAPPTAAPAT